MGSLIAIEAVSIESSLISSFENGACFAIVFCHRLPECNGKFSWESPVDYRTWQWKMANFIPLIVGMQHNDLAGGKDAYMFHGWLR